MTTHCTSRDTHQEKILFFLKDSHPVGGCNHRVIVSNRHDIRVHVEIQDHSFRIFFEKFKMIQFDVEI